MQRHGNNTATNRTNMMQISHPPTDNRPKTTHVPATVGHPFPYHKANYYKNYKYSIVSRNNMNRTSLQKQGTHSTPNITFDHESEKPVVFPLWSKPFKPLGGLKSSSMIRRPAQPSNQLTSTSHRITRGSIVEQSRTMPKHEPRVEQDLPPITSRTIEEENTPQIRVTFKFKEKSVNKDYSSCGEKEEEGEVDGLTTKRLNEYTRNEGHKDLTHNSFVKVEMWLEKLEKDGTWPVMWFSTKNKR